MPHEPTELNIFPGGDLVAKGLADLQTGTQSEEALLVLVAGPRLRGLGIPVPEDLDVPRPYEHALYSKIEARLPLSAHSAYNALIQRIVSFADSYSRERPNLIPWKDGLDRDDSSAEPPPTRG